MGKYMVVYSVGPVQSMIANARKLEDLWAGSFLLSELIEFSIAKVDEEFPDKVYWLQPVKNKDESVGEVNDTARNPNRFLCEIEAENPEALRSGLEEVSEGLRLELERLALAAVSKLEGDSSELSAEMKSQVHDQAYNFLEIFWAFLPYDASKDDFNAIRLNLEANLGSAKNDRIVHLSPQYGPVCTNCLEQNALSSYLVTGPDDFSKARQAVDQYWKKISGSGTTWKTKENEKLCAICSLKRSYRRLELGDNDTFPSVHAFAREDLTLTDENFESQSNDSEDENKYYATVMFDGDDMGQWISGEKTGETITPQKLQEISNRLSTFSSQAVNAALPANQMVKVIYSGGDDVMAVGAIRELFDFVATIHHNFGTSEKGLDEKATGSCGIVIAHEKTPLQQVVNYAREGEARSKAFSSPYIEQAKNAFSIHLNKRSGEQRVVTLPFNVQIKDGLNLPEWFSLDHSNVFQKIGVWVKTIQTLELSHNFIYDFVEIFGTLGAGDHLPFQNEEDIDLVYSQIKRLILKRISSDQDKALDLVNDWASLYYLFADSFQTYIHFLEISFYLSSLKGKGEGNDESL